MGYANTAQTDTGLHMRQRSRAFIIADSANSNNRVVFINSDIGMGDYGVRVGIVQQLSVSMPKSGCNLCVRLLTMLLSPGQLFIPVFITIPMLPSWAPTSTLALLGEFWPDL